tara:strand:+ start:404 stop:970 length:567 start_codon:yes stop_codon:yes gene_type:complete
MIQYGLFCFILFVVLSRKEGFIIYQQNLNQDNQYPDKKQFFPVSNHNTIKLKNNEKTLLGNMNYKLVNNRIVEPQHGVYSAFLDVNNLRSYDHFFHSPITDESFNFDVQYDRYNYPIIQEEDKNKEELIQLEKKHDKVIHNPFYLYGHPENNSKILYNEKIQDQFLKAKNIYNRHTNNTHSGDGYHTI